MNEGAGRVLAELGPHQNPLTQQQSIIEQNLIKKQSHAKQQRPPMLGVRP